MDDSKKIGLSPEEVIESSIGGFSRWQLFVCLAVFLVNFPLVWHELIIVFLAPKQDVNCTDPAVHYCSSDCESHVFDKSVFTETLVSEFDLVCDKAYLAKLVQTTLMVGVLIGNVSFGVFSDKCGRRKPLLVAVIIQLCTGVAIAFAPWLWLFMVLRFLCAIATGGTVLTAFVIVVEVLGRKYRSTFCILFQITYYLGHSCLGGIAYLLRDWHHIQLAISVPSVLLLSYYCLLPESPRWLMVQGRKNEAITILEKAAKHNGQPSDHIRASVHSVHIERNKSANVWDLMRTTNMQIKTICICVNWAGLGLTYFGVAQYMGVLGGDIFVNTVVAGLIQIPGNLICIFVMEKLGRKISLVLSHALCSCGCLIIIVLPKEPTWLITVAGMVGMMGVSIGFSIIYVYSGELFPTVVRNVGMGTASMFAKFGAMIAPFVTGLDEVSFWLPPLIYGVVPLVNLLVALKLPETLHCNLPDTMEEAEKFGQKVSALDNNHS